MRHGVGKLLYSVAVVILEQAKLYSTLLMLGGLMSAAVLAGVYSRVRGARAVLA